jgi:aminoglycoside/choline kinase family phosphotransferase
VKDFLNEMKSLMEVLGGDEKAPESFGKTISRVERIPGDASTRRYYRISSQGKSFIAMKMESFADQGKELDFLAVQRHLVQAKVDVPQVLDMDPAKGYILLEDLGDMTLLRRLQEVSSADVERHLYEKVIDSLIQLQVYASRSSIFISCI